MKWFITLSLIVAALVAKAQNTSLTIFNNNGQPFFVIMNGIKQNAVPHTNVKVGGMSTGSYEIKLIFADGKTGDINKKLFIDQPGNYQARVVFKGKKRKLQFFGMSDGTPVPAGGTPVQYRPNDESGYSDQSATKGQSNDNHQMNGSGTATAIPTDGSTGVVTSGNPQHSGQAIGSPTATSADHGGVNVDIQVQDASANGTGGITITTNGAGKGTPGTSVSTSTTTNSSATTVNGNVTESTYSQTTGVTQNGQTTTTTTTQNGGEVSQRPQSTAVDLSVIEAANKPPKGSPSTCKMMLTNGEEFVRALQNENFDQDKKQKITTTLTEKCVTADQAFKIVETLNFDVDRLEISKYLYDRMTDKANGERLTNLMSFDADRENFREYMRTH